MIRRSALGALLLLLLALALGGPPAQAQTGADNAGRDFWLAFGLNGGSTKTLFITGREASTGRVTIPGLEFSEPFTTTPGEVTTVRLPGNVNVATSDGIEAKGVHVTASAEVAVYGLNRRSASTDAFLGLPVDVVGTEYTVMAWGPGAGQGSQLVIAATEGPTTVRIVPSVATTEHPAGTPYTVVLAEGDVYQAHASGSDEDLTGTTISASAPVSVYGGHECGNVPDAETTFCDHVTEQLTPDETRGESFLTVPLRTRLRGDTFKFLAQVDGTEVRVNGTLVATLDAGEQHQRNITGNAVIRSTRPILVAQFANGQSFDDVESDPFMMLIPPFEQFASGYTVSTPLEAESFSGNFANLVVPEEAVGDVEVDGTPVPAGEYTPIGTSGYRGAQVEISAGSHRITGPGAPFGAFLYGFDQADSYGYPGGLSLAPIARVAAIDLSPRTSTGVVGSEHCVTATITDENGDRVPDVRVDFTVTGANPTEGSVVASATGVARFCYRGTAIGRDTITAAVGATRGTATQTFAAAAAPVVTIGASTPPSETGDTTPLIGGTAGNGPGDAARIVIEIRRGSTAGAVLQRFDATRSGTDWAEEVPEALPPGDYGVVATQSGPGGQGRAAKSFHVQDIPPGVEIDRSTPPAETGDTTPLIGGTAGDRAGDATRIDVELHAGTEDGELVERFDANRDGNAWSEEAPEELEPGVYVAVATQEGLGSPGRDTRTFRVLDVPPAVQIGATTPPSETTDPQPVIGGTAGVRPGDAVNIEVAIHRGTESGAVVATFDASRDDGATWGEAVPTALAPGTYTAVATQAGRGEPGRATKTFTVLDTTTPPVDIDATSPGATTDALPTFAGTAGDRPGDAAVIDIEIRAGTTDFGPLVQAFSVPRTGTTWRGTPPGPLAPGTYIMIARQAGAGEAGVSRRVFTVVAPPVDPPPPPPPGDKDADGVPDAQDTSDASVQPVVARTVIVRVVSGTVLVKPPASRSGARASQGRNGFVPLKGAEVIRVGSTVDTSRGRLALTSAATTRRGQTQSADFYDGVFQVRQQRAREATTEARLATSPSRFRRLCGKRLGSTSDAVASQRRRRVVSRLWGNGRGRFRTRGRHSAATVRGTIWLTEERCDGTLTRVRTGKVAVRDLNARRTVTVRTGKSYLARAQRASGRRNRG